MRISAYYKNNYVVCLFVIFVRHNFDFMKGFTLCTKKSQTDQKAVRQYKYTTLRKCKEINRDCGNVETFYVLVQWDCGFLRGHVGLITLYRM